jgi:hypothetical protein
MEIPRQNDIVGLACDHKKTRQFIHMKEKVHGFHTSPKGSFWRASPTCSGGD